MRTIPFNLFPEDEIEDVVAACKRYGMDLGWFQIKAEEEPIPGGAGPIRREVIVMHGPSGKGRRYEAGSGSHWTADFENDLAQLYYYK